MIARCFAFRHDMADMQAAPLTRITLFAPNGRMGKAIAAAAQESGTFDVDQDRGDVLIDFSSPAALPSSLELARSKNIPILVGTTGLDDEARKRIADATEHLAVLQAANTSLGIALLADLVERAARLLGPDWDVEIAELHHRMKADAPSGTALLLGEAAARGRGASVKTERGRDGTSLSRETGAIGFASIRGGTAAGDHDVLFLGPDERLILSHRAENRMIFARGALAAARFLVGIRPGLYSMRDVIGADRT